MRSRQLLFCIVLLTSAILFVFAAQSGQPAQPAPIRPGYTLHRSSFGSNGVGNTGWLMPANTIISTSYVANSSLSRFIVGTLNVFPYHVVPGTVLRLGIYLNGQLAAARDYDLTGSYKDQDISGNYNTPATMLGNVENGMANFSNSLVGFTVSEFPLKGTLPSGTMVTVTAWASHPLWVQVDRTAPVHSYEASTLASYSPSVVVAANAGTVTPYTLSVGLETNAG